MGQKGLVLFFFRSADWCPFCQAQMMDLNTAVAGMESRGYKLAGISYDTPEIQKMSFSPSIVAWAFSPRSTRPTAWAGPTPSAD